MASYSSILSALKSDTNITSACAPASFAPSATLVAITPVFPVPLQKTTATLLINLIPFCHNIFMVNTP